MKKSTILIFTAATIMGTLLMGCSNATENSDKSVKSVAETEMEKVSDMAQIKKDMAKFRLEVDKKIAENDKRIADFNAALVYKTGNAKDDFEKKVKSLQAKNEELKEKTEDLKADSQENWEILKADLKSEMDDLQTAIEDFTKKHTK
jgi:cytochrome c556